MKVKELAWIVPWAVEVTQDAAGARKEKRAVSCVLKKI